MFFIKVKRVGESKYTHVIITEEIKQYIITEYNNGRSASSLSNEIELSQKKIGDLLKEWNIPIHTNREQALKYSVNENYFEKIDTEEKAYWLGFMYADGFIQSKRPQNNRKIGITLTNSDIGHLEKFKKALNYTGDIKTYAPSKNCYKGTKPYSRILIVSDKLASDLIKLGCVENKTDILTYPTEQQVPLNLQKHFIRGYIDGDGSLMIKKDFNFAINVTGTLEVIEGIKKFLNLSHLKNQQRHPERSVNNYSFTIGGNEQVLYFVKFLYDDSSVYLERKFQKKEQMKIIHKVLHLNK